MKNYQVLPLHTNRFLFKELRFPQLFDSFPEPILITTTSGEICHVNPAWEKLTGYGFEEVKGKNPRFLHSDKTPKGVFPNIRNLLEEGKSLTTQKIIDKRKDGTEYQIYSTFFPIKKDNRSIFYVQMLHDITKQKELEQQKDTLISIVSHELKTPITSLNVYAHILEKRLATLKDKKNNYLIKNVLHQTNRLVGLIDDLLHVSRMDAGKLDIHKKPFDLNGVVEKVLIDFQYSTESHQIEKRGDIKGFVMGDDFRIEQVLINLLTNAIKYSPKGSNVLIYLKQDAHHAFVTVRDFGSGIEKEDIPHIFDRFYRSKEKSDKHIPGFGLGLYISSEIIHRHGSKIKVESIKNKGSTFSFSLPFV